MTALLRLQPQPRLQTIPPCPSQARQPYLHRRGGSYYFKRRIPAAVAHAFPEYREQVWKSLDTPLLETAKVRLAVESTEFELRAATARRELACRSAAAWSGQRTLSLVPSRPDTDGHAGAEAAGTASSAAPTGPRATARDRPPTAAHEVQGSVPATAAKIQTPVGTQLTPRPTMFHLFEDWKRGQARERPCTMCSDCLERFVLLKSRYWQFTSGEHRFVNL